jgi:adenine-specific DNA-methyltransferase
VLKLLQQSYHQRVKMIYIDPPYNTGKDFIYPDNYRDNIANYLELTGQTGEDGRKLAANPETSGRYHTHWLNMMYPRLKLARNLLRDDGVIFISIDDTEVANLRKLCDEIFGEENFLSNVIWHKKYAASNDVKGIAPMHDHILVYQKSGSFERNLLPRTEKQDSLYKYDSNDGKGLWRPDNLSVKTVSESYLYPIINPKTGKTYMPPAGRCWLTSSENMQNWINESRVFFGQSGDGAPQLKRYLSEVQQGIVPQSYWSYEEVGHTDSSRKELKALFNDPPFDNPKSTGVIIRSIQIGCVKDDLILDFFSGSGTTAHAVMALNAEDGGNRKFIMVQLPEPTDKPDYPTIADIGKERIRRAGEKILTDKGSIINLDVGFKVFKLDSTNIKPWDVGFDDLETSLPLFADSLQDDRSNDDVLYEILLKYGLDLSLPITTHTLAGKTVYSIGMGALVVCLDKAITLDTVEGIAKLKDKLQPEDSLMRVVFRDSGFADDVVKVNAVQILKQAGIEDVRSV